MQSSEPKPVFLTGFPKSGTTLLLSLLDGHPELCVFPKESKFFEFVRGWLKHDRNEAMGRFFDKLLIGRQFGMLQPIPVPVSKERYIHALEERWKARSFKTSAFLGAAVLAYGDLTGQSGRKWWVEKTPLTERYGSVLSRWYPGMRMIYIIRDPRANYAAMKRWRERDGRRADLPRFAHGWESSVLQNQQNQMICQVLTLRYEDLVADAANCMDKVCRFLEITYHDCLLTPTLAGNPFDGNSTSGERFTEVSRSPLDKWQEVLAAKEVIQLQQLLGRCMRQYGYERKVMNQTFNLGPVDLVRAYLVKRSYDLRSKPKSILRARFSYE